MASKRTRITDRFRFDLLSESGGPNSSSCPRRPRGVNSGRWILIGPVKQRRLQDPRFPRHQLTKTATTRPATMMAVQKGPTTR
jgi:hypothetical protein